MSNPKMEYVATDVGSNPIFTQRHDMYGIDCLDSRQYHYHKDTVDAVRLKVFADLKC